MAYEELYQGKVGGLPGMRDMANRVKYPEAYSPGTPNQTTGFDRNPGSRLPVIKPTAVLVDGPYNNVPPRSTIDAGKNLIRPVATGMQPASDRVLNINDPSLGNQRVFGSQVDRPGNTSGFRVQGQGLQTTAQPGTGWIPGRGEVYEAPKLLSYTPEPKFVGPRPQPEHIARAAEVRGRTGYATPPEQNPYNYKQPAEPGPFSKGPIKPEGLVSRTVGALGSAYGALKNFSEKDYGTEAYINAKAAQGDQGAIQAQQSGGANPILNRMKDSVANGLNVVEEPLGRGVDALQSKDFWDGLANHVGFDARQSNQPEQPRSNYKPTLNDMGIDAQQKGVLNDGWNLKPGQINPNAQTPNQAQSPNKKSDSLNDYINKQMLVENNAMSRGPAGLTRYTQGPNGELLRQGSGGEISTLSGPPVRNRQSPAAEAAGTTDAWYNNGYTGGVAQYRKEKEQQAIYQNMDGLMADAMNPNLSQEARANAQKMFTALAGRVSDLDSQYTQSQGQQIQGRNQQAQLGLQERQYNDQAPEREFSANVVRKKNEVLQGDNGFEKLGLSQRDKDRYKAFTLDKNDPQTGVKQGESAAVIDTYTGKVNGGGQSNARSPADYMDFYGKLLAKFNGNQERAMQEYNNYFANNQG